MKTSMEAVAQQEGVVSYAMPSLAVRVGSDRELAGPAEAVQTYAVADVATMRLVGLAGRLVRLA